MIRRMSVSVLAAAACALIAGGASGQVALASVSTPLAASGYSVQAAPPAKTCAANYTQGTIGGQPKCLAAGQQCQQANAKDYTQYGFTCGKVGTRFQLTKNSGAKPAAKPTVAPKPAAKPAPAHH